MCRQQKHTNVKNEKREGSLPISERSILRRMVMGRNMSVVLTGVVNARITRLSRTTDSSNDFVVGAHGLFVASHLRLVTARETVKNKRKRKSSQQ